MDVAVAQPAVNNSQRTHSMRPTQAYFVPRRLLDNSRSPQPADHLPVPDSKHRHSPPQAPPPSQKLRPSPERPAAKPRPLMEQQLARPNELLRKGGAVAGGKERSKEQTPPKQQQPTRNNACRQKSPTSSEKLNRDSASPKTDVSATKAAVLSASDAAAPPLLFPRVLLPSSMQKMKTEQPQPLLQRPLSASEAEAAGSRGCICERPPKHISCRRCGYECIARLSLVCSLHPLVMPLMDLRVCPNPRCHSQNLVELGAPAIAPSETL